ncbi:MAG: response regulator [Woeseiaceae bacterium]|nr:response regulator [Woeseiaceae bacterium]
MPKRKLLIVEDSEQVRQRIRKTLESQNDIVIAGEASDVSTAISLIDSIDPDLVTLDIRLDEGGNGLDVLRYIRQSGKRPHVVVLAFNFNQQYLPADLAACAARVLDKVKDFEQLPAALATANAPDEDAELLRQPRAT